MTAEARLRAELAAYPSNDPIHRIFELLDQGGDPTFTTLHVTGASTLDGDVLVGLTTTAGDDPYTTHSVLHAHGGAAPGQLDLRALQSGDDVAQNCALLISIDANGQVDTGYLSTIALGGPNGPGIINNDQEWAIFTDVTGSTAGNRSLQVQSGEAPYNIPLTLNHDGSVALTGNIGFFAHAPAARPTVTGSRGGNAAVASLLTALAGLGLLTDSTS